MKKLLTTLCIGLVLLSPEPLKSQAKNTAGYDTFLEGYKFRSIGPSRGGRSTAVTGVASNPHLFYMGSTGGGVWKTNDAGTTWNNISDGFFNVGSIGAIAVAPSDENVIYVGSGSACPRGNISSGDGMYKSTDKGKTWTHIGLEKSGMIGRIIIDPVNENIVYAAVLGNPFGPNPERGVYKSNDGGITWDKVLFVSARTGAVDLEIHPTNKRVLFAAMWTVERKPWTIVDGSEEGGIWKSSDSGITWTKVEGGLPSGIIGRSGITISPANPDKMWVITETAKEKDGGIYHSEDGGTSWSKINRDHNLRQRAWYYNHIVAHPTDEHTIYVMNAGFHRSIDSGKSFERVRTPHGDNHDLWIHPIFPDIMIEANDGGACVTLNNCKTWSSIYNQPTAEFYRVTVDNQYPYRVYGAQQDNSTISIPSRSQKGLSPIQEWYSVGGGESGHISVDPRDPNLIYAGTYIGQIDRTDIEQGHQQDIVAYPQMHDGTAPRDIKFRFQWNAPIIISPHNPDQVYHCSQFVHTTMDKGVTWKTISTDLTTNNDDHQNIPGGPVQHDHTGVELYNTIFAFAESKHNVGELWTGSDDGLIHLSKDGGENWKNITPKNMPEGGTVNSLDLSAHQPGKAVVAVYRYRDNDFTPYIFLTTNFGKTWKNLVTSNNGIPNNHFVRVVREDPYNENILYAGTEFGLYISLDNGESWDSFQNNLPITPITDMVVHQGDLVIATQGRSFWILDKIHSLGEFNKQDISSLKLFSPTKVYRSRYRQHRGVGAPDPAPSGAMIEFYIPDELTDDDQFELVIRDESNVIRRRFSTKADKENNVELIKVKKGLNRFQWDLRYESPKPQPKSVFSLASMSGIKAPLGSNTVELKLNGQSQTSNIEILRDPRWTQTAQDLTSQYELTMQVKSLFDDSHQAIGDLRSINKQLKNLADRNDLTPYSDILSQCESIRKSSEKIENQLIQNKSESGQDPINHPSMIDDQIAYLYSNLNGQDHKPSSGARERLTDLTVELEPLLAETESIKEELKKLNEELKKLNIPMIKVDSNKVKP